MAERFAIYYAPAVTSDLWRRAQEWLGPEPLTGLPAAARRDRHVQSARHYGFHATLKAPMVLAPGRTAAELEAALARFAAERYSVNIGSLVIRSLNGFLALVAEAQSPDLTGFVQAVVTAFEPFRAAASEQDLARRRQAGLTQRQNELLEQFGYPYVAEQFRFHMTLTERLSAVDEETLKSTANDWFAPALASPFMLDRLVLFHQATAESAFTRGRDFLLGRAK